MSSITAADLKFGGRLVTACDAMAAGHLRTAAGIFMEVANELNEEAEFTTGLLGEDAPDERIEAAIAVSPPAKQPDPMDLQSCARGAHSFGPPDPVSGWRVCASCGLTNVTGPNDGPIDMGARQ